MEKVPMTQGGYDMLQAELKRRQSEERPAIIAAIAEARAHGDLSENAEYHAAKEQQSHNEGRVSELEDLLSRAEVIDVKKLSGSTVKFGATVTLIDEETEDLRHDYRLALLMMRAYHQITSAVIDKLGRVPRLPEDETSH